MPTFPQESPEPPVSPPDTASPDAPIMVETREQFVERALAEYESPLVGYAFGFVKDIERARDIVQDTFIRLCQQDVAKVRDGLKTWLYTVCRNRALDQAERLAEVMRFLDRLSENQRTVILMKFRDGMSYHEICEQTGLSSGNVGFLIHTGLKRMREMLPADLLDSNSGSR